MHRSPSLRAVKARPIGAGAIALRQHPSCRGRRRRMSGMPSQSKTSAFALRDVKEADREAMLDLWVAAWREAMPAIDFDHRRKWLRAASCAAGSPGLRDALRDRLPRGRVLGFIALSPKLRHLDQIVVDLDHWGKGVGETLIAEAKRISPRGLWLDVNQDNPRAIAFYEKHGFRRLRAGRTEIGPADLSLWMGRGERAERVE